MNAGEAGGKKMLRRVNETKQPYINASANFVKWSSQVMAIITENIVHTNAT